MEKVSGSISHEENGLRYEKMLLTYSEEEQQEQEVIRETAKLVFSPKFIPFYPELLKFNLSVVEILIFGFIDFYLSNSSGKFYFTNEQIGNIVGCSEWTSSQSISNLREKGFIGLDFKLKSNGGKIRYVRLLKNQQSDYGKINSPTIEKSNENKNKINKNKINIERDKSLPSQINQKEIIEKYADKYLVEVIIKEMDKFISYWTEKNNKGKERWKGEKFFDINRRISTWLSNSNDFSKLKPLNEEEYKNNLIISYYNWHKSNGSEDIAQLTKNKFKL